jgi:hypothetical protein
VVSDYSRILFKTQMKFPLLDPDKHICFVQPVNRVRWEETLESLFLNVNERTQTALAEVGNHLDAAGREIYTLTIIQ